MSSPTNRDDAETGAAKPAAPQGRTTPETLAVETVEQAQARRAAARRLGLIIAAILILIALIVTANWLGGSRKHIRTDERASVLMHAGAPTPTTFDPTLR